MKKKLLALVIASIATLSLAACGAVPDSGPVREGLTSLTQVERSVFLNPQGPAKDADQEAIVRGFVRAASSNANDYEIAREFLAPTYADQWDPSLGVIVNEGARQYQSSEEGIAVMSMHAVATVDAGGTLRPAAPDESVLVQFELAQVGGQWRIISAPNGIIIDRSTFSMVWTTRPLYFVSPDQRLVSEVRWVLGQPSLLPVQIVRGLIAGPSALMTGAVTTAFPEGTTLTGRDIPIVDGTAVIDLSPELLDADGATVANLTRQIATSLQGLPGVMRFQIVVQGAVLSGGEVPISEEQPTGDYQSIAVMKEGEFGLAVGATLDPMSGISERVVGLAPQAATIAPDLASVVVLHSGGVSLVTKDQSVVIDERTGLAAPGIDSLGYIWTYSASDADEVSVSSPGNPRVDLPAPWLDGRAVKAMRVSMGGNRIAALVGDQTGGSMVLVAGIVRGEDGAPIGFTEQAEVQLWDPGAPLDFDWIGDSRFVLLSETGLLGGSAKVTIGEVSGRFPSDSGAVSGGVSISGGGSSRALLRVLDDQRRMFAPQGSGWQQLMKDVDLLAKVG